MITTLLSINLPMLAQSDPAPIPQEAYRQVSSLTLMFAILGILLITVLSFIVVLRRSRRRKEALPKPASIEHVDAWAEAGRRFDNSIIEIDIDDN